MQDYRWVWTVIFLLIICYALVSLLREYRHERRQRSWAQQADGDTVCPELSAYAGTTAEQADRWVLLRPPTRAELWGWRIGTVVVFLVMGAFELGMALSEFAEPSAPWRWPIFALGVVMTLVGAAWSWRAASRPRTIAADVVQLRPDTARRRRVARALRRGDPIPATDRPAAAAYAASCASRHATQPAAALASGGLVVTLLSSVTGSGQTWLALAAAMALAVTGPMADASWARTVHRAAASAGVAPRIA